MGSGFLGESQFFLISQPRAGSTLLQRILAGHPLVLTSAESWLMLHPIYALRDEGYQAEYNARWAHNALQDFLTHYADGEATCVEAIRAWASVLYERALRGTGKAFFLDKTPRYYFIISELYRLFPKAKFIFLIRNPLAVLASIITTWTGDSWPRLAEYRHDLLAAPMRILEGVRQLGDQAIIVCYEHLVTNPEEAVSSLCHRLGIPYYADMLHYGGRPIPRGRMGDESGVHRHEKPSVDSVSKWVQLADTEQTQHLALAYLDELGAETVERLGYSFEELYSAIGGGSVAPTARLVPWHIAVRPDATWTRQERLTVARAMAIQREGMLRGTVSFVRQNFYSIARSLVP